MKSWRLDGGRKAINNGYYMFKALDSDGKACKLRLEQVVNFVAPVISEASATTSFRWRLTPQLKEAFEHVGGAFVHEHVAPLYEQLFGRALSIDVIDDSVSYIRLHREGKMLHLKLAEAIPSLRAIKEGVACTYDFEFRGVGIKETGLHFDWKLIQVSVEGPRFKRKGGDADGDAEADVSDAEADDDMAEPSPEDYEESMRELKGAIASHIATLHADLAACQELEESLIADPSPENLGRVYNRWVAATER